MIKKKKAAGKVQTSKSTDTEILAFLNENLFWVRWVPVTFVCLFIALCTLIYFRTTEKQIVADSQHIVTELRQDDEAAQKAKKANHDELMEKYLFEIKTALQPKEPVAPTTHKK